MKNIQLDCPKYKDRININTCNNCANRFAYNDNHDAVCCTFTGKQTFIKMIDWFPESNVNISVKNDQRLVDICFEIGLLISDQRYDLYTKSKEEKAEWIAKQLRICGFDTQPMGSSWGKLK